MKNLSPQLLDLARKQRYLLTRELVSAGVSGVQISRMVASGTLVRMGRGVFVLPGYLPSEHGLVALVAARAPHAIVCLLTALRFHGLTSQAPFEVWLAVGNAGHPPRISYPPIRVVRFSGIALTEGIAEVTVEGHPVRMTTVARTVADCFKFRNKIGFDVALEALREAWRERRVTMDELWRAAQTCRVTNVMRPYLESLT